MSLIALGPIIDPPVRQLTGILESVGMIQPGQQGFAIRPAIEVGRTIRTEELRSLAKRIKNAAHARRPLAIAALFDGESRKASPRLAAWTAGGCGTE
jgi:hypothetical protein